MAAKSSPTQIISSRRRIHGRVDYNSYTNRRVNKSEIDGSRLKKLVDNALENNALKRVIADGAYDNKENFQYLLDKNIDAAIKVRKNSSYDRSIGSYSRKIAVLKQLKNFEKWKTKVSYSSRWIAETAFSSLKRMFGEYVSAKKFPNMVKEMILKTSLYNMFIVGK